MCRGVMMENCRGVREKLRDDVELSRGKEEIRES